MRDFIAVSPFAAVLFVAILACGGPREAAPEGESPRPGQVDVSDAPSPEAPVTGAGEPQVPAPGPAAAVATPEVETCPRDNPWAIPFEFHGRCLALVPVTARDNIPAIFEPKFVDADNKDLPRHESVIGVSVNGDHRAYPIGHLSNHEVVNDTVGGVPILVTW